MKRYLFILCAVCAALLAFTPQVDAFRTGGGGGGDTNPAGAPGAYQINTAGAFAAGTLHESATSRWMVNTAGWVTDEWPKSGATLYVHYRASGVTDYTSQASGVSTQELQVRQLGFPDGTKQTTAIAAAVAGADGAYQVNTGGVLGGGSLHESGGSTFVVDTAGHVLKAFFAATGEVVEYWNSGETNYWKRGSTQSWHYDDPAGVSHFVTDPTGVTGYAPTGDVLFGTYENGLNDFPVTSGATGAAVYVGAGGRTLVANTKEIISGNTQYTISGSGNTIFSFCWDTNVWNRYNDAATGGTVFTVDKSGFHGTWAYGSMNLANNAIPWAAVRTYDAFLDQSKTRSGASLVSVGAAGNTHLSGNSLVSTALNTVVTYGRNNAAGSYQLIGLPPVSGTSTWFVQFQFQGNTGGVIFEGNESQNIFYGRVAGTLEHNNGKASGVSAVVVPAGMKFEEVTFKGISGVTNYIYFDATSGISVFERG